MKKRSKKNKTTKNRDMVIGVIAIIILTAGVTYIAGAGKGGRSGGGTTVITPLPNAGQPHSLQLLGDAKQYLSIADTQQHNLDLSDRFTIEAWININKTANYRHHTIVSKFRGQSVAYKDKIDKSYAFLWKNETVGKLVPELNMILSPDTQSSYVGSNPDAALYLEPGTWRHVAFTYDANDPFGTPNGRFYVDGVQHGFTGDINWIMSDSKVDFVIGAGEAGADHFLDGKVDEVRVWNVKRSPEEIAAHYNKELIGTEAGLVGYWKFNAELVDGKVRDSSASGNHLQLHNNPQFTADTPL